MVSFKEFCEFQKLIVGKSNRKNLCEEKEVSRKTLSVKFKVFFDKPVSPVVLWRLLPPTLSTIRNPWILAIDGTWLHRQGVVMIYRDVTHHQNIFHSYHSSESYQALCTDLDQLRKIFVDHPPSGVISDWKGSIRSGVATYLGDDIPHQRCLTHVERETKRLLPKRSSFKAVVILRDLAKQLLHIKTRNQTRNWKARLIEWEMAFGHLLKEKTINNFGGTKKWWYTHGDLRRAWNLLTNDWYPFFVFLDHHLIPKTNNSLEGVNSQAKRFLSNHRGMKTPQQVSFLFWYLTFTRTKSRQDLKKLWGWWKA